MPTQSNSSEVVVAKVEWNRITGTRDKLIHHYFGVDLDMVWEVVKREIPVLRKKMKDILKKEEGYWIS